MADRAFRVAMGSERRPIHGQCPDGGRLRASDSGHCNGLPTCTRLQVGSSAAHRESQGAGLTALVVGAAVGVVADVPVDGKPVGVGEPVLVAPGEVVEVAVDVPVLAVGVGCFVGVLLCVGSGDWVCGRTGAFVCWVR